MKKILLSIIILFSISAFVYPQKKKLKKQKDVITQIAFKTFTRRASADVTITKDSAINVGRTESKYILVTPAQWDELVNTLKSVKLSTIPAMVSPTKQREVDGAAHCMIAISTKSNHYESKYFDGGKPMKQLQALYDAIAVIRTKIDEEGLQYQK